MDTLEFLQWVLPTEGYYAAIAIDRGALQQALYTTVEELAEKCLWQDGHDHNIYYALSSFKTRTNRKQTNVHLTKALFIDVDCGEEKPFANQKEGLAALQKFIRQTQIPMPMIVSSGRGLHVYWVLSEALEPAQWKPLADALKAACLNSGFAIDPSVTGDSARVLRPIGTHNPKNGKEVVVLLLGDAVDAHTMHNKLLSFIPQSSGTSTTTPILTAPPMPARTSQVMQDMKIEVDLPPANPGAVMEKCQQIKWAVANQDKVPEPLWYSLLGIAAYCLNPEDTAKAWSSQHPGYSEAATLNKMAQWKASTTGPATCSKIDNDRPKGCDKCPIAGKIVTPAQIGVRREAVPTSADAPDPIAHELKLPKSYKNVLVNGIVHMVQTLDGTDIDVCPFEIYPVGYGRDESLGYETVRYKWRRQHMGWQDLVFRQAYLNYGNPIFPTSISDQGIVLRGKKQTEGFQVMLRSYMDELRKVKAMTNIHGEMGWKNDFTQFVIGDKLYSRNEVGTVTSEDISLATASRKISSTMYGHKGSPEAWIKLTSILNDMPWHVFGLGHGFSAPLWALSGLKGITISLHGPSGGGKSIIQLWQQSIWGNPDKLHMSAESTRNALFNRLGTYCHLPMTIDEASTMENVGEFCYWVSQGEDKKRLTKTIEEREVKIWATPVTISTNTSFISKMSATGLSTDAQMARLFEVNIPLHHMFHKSSEGGRKLARFLKANYGHIGDKLIRIYLSVGEARLRELIEQHAATFGERYNCKFVGAERYWETALVLIDVAYSIAFQYGLIAFDYAKGIQWAVDQLDTLRGTVIENHTDAFKLIHEYLNESAADILVVMHTDGLPSTMDQTRIPRGEIKARFDKFRPGMKAKFDHGTVMIVQKQFKKWVSSRGYDYNTLRKEVRIEGIDATPHNKRFWMGRNTSLDAGQQTVFGINLNHEFMKGYLDDVPLTPEEQTLGQLSEVSST